MCMTCSVSIKKLSFASIFRFVRQKEEIVKRGTVLDRQGNPVNTDGEDYRNSDHRTV